MSCAAASRRRLYFRGQQCIIYRRVVHPCGAAQALPPSRSSMSYYSSSHLLIFTATLVREAQLYVNVHKVLYLSHPCADNKRKFSCPRKQSTKNDSTGQPATVSLPVSVIAKL
jgi:hypothetical protein